MHFDSHIHVGNFNAKLTEDTRPLLAYKEYSKHPPDVCMRRALSNGVAKAVIFPFPLIEHPFSKQNDYILEASQKYPYFFIPFLLPESAAELEKKKDKFVGIKNHFYFDFNNQVNHDETLSFAQDNRKIYIFHAHREKWEEQVSYICKNFPKLKVIIAHAARPAPFSGVDISVRISEFLKTIPYKLLDNFYFETSTIRDSQAIEQLVSAFGAEHILWGTDSPYCSNAKENIFASEIDIIEQAKLADSDKELIFTKNFRRLYQCGQIWIRQAMPEDCHALLTMLETVSPPEQRNLALSQKLALIKKQMKSGGHILVAESPSGEIVGFLRGSDRHDKCVMIEEIYVLPKARGQKVATKLIQSICPSYNSAEVKTFSTNIGMNTTLTKLHFAPKYSLKRTMISWKK